MIERDPHNDRQSDPDRDEIDDAIDRDMCDPNAAADQTAAAWLDENRSSRDAVEPATDPQDARTNRRLADLQFLHVLLGELHNSSATATSERVESALAAIRRADDSDLVEAATADSQAEPVTLAHDEPAVASPAPAVTSRQDPLLSRRKWLISSAAVAAGLSGVAAWIWSAGSSRTAHAAVQKVAQDARIPRDRQYRVTSDLNHARGEQGRIESLLYVRGGEKFALVHRGALGDVWIGSNGRQSWLVPVIGPPIINDNPRYPGGWSGDEGVALPDLQLTTLLDLMAERFQLSMLPNDVLPDRPEVMCQRISGWCEADDAGPKRIELWAHLQTGVAQRLVLQWLRSPDEAGLTRIQLDLLSEKPRADAFYEVDSHRRGRVILPKIPILPSASPN